MQNSPFRKTKGMAVAVYGSGNDDNDDDDDYGNGDCIYVLLLSFLI